MAGLAVALEAGVDLDAAVAALASLSAGDKRGQVIEIDGATILNDSYNSNPEALRSMIRTLAARPARPPHPGGRRDAGTGRIWVPQCTSPAGSPPRRPVWTWWPAYRATRYTWPRLPVPAGWHRSFCPRAEERRPLARGRRCAPGDVVLVKGSRGVHLERAIEMVKEQLAATGAS